MPGLLCLSAGVGKYVEDWPVARDVGCCIADSFAVQHGKAKFAEVYSICCLAGIDLSVHSTFLRVAGCVYGVLSFTCRHGCFICADTHKTGIFDELLLLQSS